MSFFAEERILDIELSESSAGAGGSCTFSAIIFPLLVPRAIKSTRFFLYLAQHNIIRVIPNGW